MAYSRGINIMAVMMEVWNLVKDGAWVLFIVFMLVGWRINFVWSKKQGALDARLDDERDTYLDQSEYNYLKAQYLREKYFQYISFWLAIISVILIGILLKLD